MVVEISKVSKNGSTLNIEWSDGEQSNFNFMWLRDNCPTAHDKDSRHRMFEPHDSDWHIEKLGLLYKRNTKLNGSTWSTRAVEIATVKQINLTSDEIMALLTAPNEQPYNDLARLLKSANTLLVK